MRQSFGTFLPVFGCFNQCALAAKKIDFPACLQANLQGRDHGRGRSRTDRAQALIVAPTGAGP